MFYRAVINLDFGDKDTNEYQKLIAALMATDWKYVETSALWIETDNLGKIWRGAELIARQCGYAGELTALTLHIQGTEFPDGKDYSAANNHKNAVNDILARPMPKP